MIDQPIEDRQRVGAHDEFVVIGPEPIGDGPRMLQLVERGLVEADRKCLDLRRRLRHQADDDTRVDAAGEECAERHVADEVCADRIGQHLTQATRSFFFAARE